MQWIKANMKPTNSGTNFILVDISDNRIEKSVWFVCKNNVHMYAEMEGISYDPIINVGETKGEKEDYTAWINISRGGGGLFYLFFLEIFKAAKFC